MRRIALPPTLDQPVMPAHVRKNLDKVAPAVDVRGIHEAAEIVQLPLNER